MIATLPGKCALTSVCKPAVAPLKPRSSTLRKLDLIPFELAPFLLVCALLARH